MGRAKINDVKVREMVFSANITVQKYFKQGKINKMTKDCKFIKVIILNA